MDTSEVQNGAATDFDGSRREGATLDSGARNRNDFDSHVCFAAATPVLVPGSAGAEAHHRIYYMVSSLALTSPILFTLAYLVRAGRKRSSQVFASLKSFHH